MYNILTEFTSVVAPWEGRFRSCIAQEDNYLLHCMRYIELNPVRAEMVMRPADYKWSSYRCNAQEERNKLIKAFYVRCTGSNEEDATDKLS